MAIIGNEKTPVDLRSRFKCAWDDSLRPRGHDTFDKEKFEDWHTRISPVLNHLEPRIAEQWIYRHFQNSPFCSLPLERLVWRLETWSANKMVSHVIWLDKDRDDPQADYQANQKLNPDREPRLTFDATGTWNIPVVVLEAPGGIITTAKYISGPAFHLIEGHRRMRYLRGLYVHGDPMRDHEIFILGIR